VCLCGVGVSICMGFVMCGCVYVWVFVMCGCFDNCVGVLVICVLVFTLFYIVLLVYIYSYLLLVRTTAIE